MLPFCSDDAPMSPTPSSSHISIIITITRSNWLWNLCSAFHMENIKQHTVWLPCHTIYTTLTTLGSGWWCEMKWGKWKMFGCGKKGKFNNNRYPLGVCCLQAINGYVFGFSFLKAWHMENWSTKLLSLCTKLLHIIRLNT